MFQWIICGLLVTTNFRFVHSQGKPLEKKGRMLSASFKLTSVISSNNNHFALFAEKEEL